MPSSDERAEGSHLPQAAKVEVPEVRKNSDAAAELTRAGTGAENSLVQAHAVRRIHGVLGRGSAHPGFANRRKRSVEVRSGARESRDRAKKSGLPVNIMSGGSTGTYSLKRLTAIFPPQLPARSVR